MPKSLLDDWANFYVIVGSAAAGLTGLTFVVISLASEKRRVSEAGFRAFVTPTIVHFGVILALSAYLSVPHQSAKTLCVGLVSGGIGGLLYVAAVANGMRGFSSLYVPVREDWIWNAILPAAAYATLLTMGILCASDLEHCLYGVAAVCVGLLFIGIHNAWDVAVWNSVDRHNEQKDSDADPSHP
jgi:hypothetical protein